MNGTTTFNIVQYQEITVSQKQKQKRRDQICQTVSLLTSKTTTHPRDEPNLQIQDE